MEATTKTRRLKKLFKTALKIAFTLAAIWWVFASIDTGALLSTLLNADPLWLLPAFLAFNASKITSSVRLNHYFKALKIRMGERQNLRLYYMGMFYNLFLPGGISGDGYKVYLLHKRHGTAYKPLLQATLLDRVSGLAALCFFAGLLFVFSSFSALHAALAPLALLGVLAVLPVNYMMTKKLFAPFFGVLKITTLYAFAVQFLQLVSAFFIVLSISGGGAMVDYLTLFLISSVIAVLPISIGGIGVRELTFLYGFGLIGGDVNAAVAFSLLFFLITAFSSLAGAFMKVSGHAQKH